ncbi:hypothetical protein [Microbacterium sp. JB110]|uniref:hypothetical protein n=1 Tax=Microbacterium sp. JB110 TaxID=2024477 RepID=UPI000B3634CD|nr:hypothetical protein [Microbacterium sp. JB110]RCS63056.1 hypothetical protein CIK77_02365 [Microbacterium sp. JB110]
MADEGSAAVSRVGWRDVIGSVGTAGRLIGRHWPRMLTAALLGIAFRNAVIWGAVALSASVPWLAQVVLVLAPLGYLVPIVYMLRLCADDLPRLRAAIAADAPDSPTEGRQQRLIDVSVSVLVPFLAVYTAYDLLEEDRNRFVNAAAADELFNGFSAPEGIDLLGRLQLNNPLWMILSLVAVALIVRWLLGRVERVWRFVGIAFLGAFIELFWTIYVSEQLQDGLRSAMNWLLDRTFVVAMIDWWDGLVDALGWLGIPLDFSVSWLVGLFGSIGPVIVVPIAWLVVASVVLGHRLTPPERLDHPALRRATRSVPDRVKRVGSSLLSDIGGRWAAFFGGVGLVLRTGLVPILAFCIVFLIPNLVPTVVSWCARWLIGPTDAWTFLAFAPWETAIGLALQLVATAPIVAAALDRFLMPISAPTTSEEAAR